MADSPDDADRSDEPNASDGDEFEFERAYDRESLAAVFREFADAFDAGRPIRLDGDEQSVTLVVPQRIVAEFEAERDPGAEPPVAELELELEWDDPDGSSVRITDRDATDENGTPRGRSDAEGAADEANEADADPAAAVMPLEGVADRGGHGDEPTADGDDEDAGTEPTVTARCGAHAAGTANADKPGDTERTSRFEVYEDKAGQWRWRLVHWNGNIIADSGEGYASRSNAERAARSVMRSAPTASIRRLRQRD